MQAPKGERIHDWLTETHHWLGLLSRHDIVRHCGTPASVHGVQIHRIWKTLDPVVQVMKRHGVKRLICITGLGAGDSKGHGGFLYDKLILPLILQRIYDDKDRQEAGIRQSNLDWTIVRPGGLTDDPAKGHYQVMTDLTGVTARKISRADEQREQNGR